MHLKFKHKDGGEGSLAVIFNIDAIYLSIEDPTHRGTILIDNDDEHRLFEVFRTRWRERNTPMSEKDFDEYDGSDDMWIDTMYTVINAAGTHSTNYILEDVARAISDCKSLREKAKRLDAVIEGAEEKLQSELHDYWHDTPVESAAAIRCLESILKLAKGGE